MEYDGRRKRGGVGRMRVDWSRSCRARCRIYVCHGVAAITPRIVLYFDTLLQSPALRERWWRMEKKKDANLQFKLRWTLRARSCVCHFALSVNVGNG